MEVSRVSFPGWQSEGGISLYLELWLVSVMSEPALCQLWRNCVFDVIKKIIGTAKKCNFEATVQANSVQCFTGMEDRVSLLEPVLSKSCKTHKIRLRPNLLSLLCICSLEVLLIQCTRVVWKWHMGMSASVILVHCGMLFWLYTQAITTDINNVLCPHICLLWHLLYWIWQESWKLCCQQYFYIYILFFHKWSGLVQSQHERCLLHWAGNAANRAAGTCLPRLHLSESALLCKLHSYWID